MSQELHSTFACKHVQVFTQIAQSSRNSVTAPVDSPARTDRQKIFTLNRKDLLSVAEWLGFGQEGLICTDTDITEKYTNICNVVSPSGPRGTPSGPPGGGNLFRLLFSHRHSSVPFLY